MSEKVKSIFLDNTTVHSDNIVDHDLTKSWQTIFGADNPNINNDSLVAYWRFFDDSFFDSFYKTSDSSENDHHIIYPAEVNVPALSYETPFNNNNTTVSFDGSVSMGQVSDHDDLSFVDGTTNKPFSISFWFKFKDLPVYDATATYNFATILTKRGVAVTTREYSVFFQKVISTDINSLHFRIYDDDVDRYVQAKIILSENYVLGEWYHATATFDGSQESDFDPSTEVQGLELRINGENKNTTYAASSATGVTLDNETYALYIGVKPGPEQYLHTFLSELAIWNRKLTAAEAKALHDVKYGAMSNSFTSYSPRLMLRDADNRRGQYPTVRRTGDKDRSGSFNIQFNDENTVEYKKIPTVYPGEKDQSFSITDGSTSYTYSSQASLVAHWRPQDAVIPTSEGFPIIDHLGRTRFLGGGIPVQGQAYIENKVPGGQIANVENFAEIQTTDDPRHNSYTERDGKLYETRGTRNSYKYLYNGAVASDGLNIGTAATWDAIIGKSSAGGTEKMTFSSWVRLQSAGGSSKGIIFNFGGSPNISLYINSSFEIVFIAFWSGGFVHGTSTATLPLNEWSHITVTYDSALLTNDPVIYLNGVETASSRSTTYAPTTTNGGIFGADCYIANDHTFTRAWDGDISSPAIWNNTLSASEVKALYLNDTRWNPDITSTQEVQYPIGLLKDDSRLPELTPDITSKGLVTRSHGGESFNIITDGEDISAYNDELDKTQDTDFYNVGTDREVYPGFSSPLRSKTSFTFDITATEEQYVFRQTGDANPTGEFIGEDYTGFCYYAFGKNKWEQIGLINPIDGSDRLYIYAAGMAHVVNDGLSVVGPQNFPMQFSGRSGFSIYGNDASPSSYAADKTVLGYEKIGTPTITSFAPFGTQYHATSSQTLLTDTFINSPFLVEKISISLPIVARHLVLETADKTRDLSNYVAFLYLQRNSKVQNVTNSERTLIAASSFCFYNNKVLTDIDDNIGEYIPFSPIHDYDFSHEFDIDAMVDFDDDIILEFTPEIFNSVKTLGIIPNITDARSTIDIDQLDLPWAIAPFDPVITPSSNDKLIFEDTTGVITEFRFRVGPVLSTDIQIDAGDYAETMINAATIINNSGKFIATTSEPYTTLTIQQIITGIEGKTDAEYYDSSAGTTTVLGTMTGPTYEATSHAFKHFWPGGSSVNAFTVDGSSEYAGKAADIDLTYNTTGDIGNIIAYGDVFNEYKGDLGEVNENTNIHKAVTRHIKNYGTNRTNKESAFDADTVETHDYFSVKDLSQKTAFVILPGDELILGIEKTTCGDRLGPGTTSGAFKYGLTSQQAFSGSYIKIKAEPASMTLYGSLIKENKEHHNTINQDLTSNSVHETLYGDPVLDEFEIEPISMYAGTTRDEYVSGDMFTGKNEELSIGFRNVDKTVTGGDVYDSYEPSKVWSLTRFEKFVDESERYYDTILPNILDYMKTMESYTDTSGDIWSGEFMKTGYSSLFPDTIIHDKTGSGYDSAPWRFITTFPFSFNLVREDNVFRYYYSTGLSVILPASTKKTSELTFMEGHEHIDSGNPSHQYVDIFGQTGGCRGFKHGVRNTTPITTTASFRSNSYGQFRDMLEQRQFGRFYKTRSFSPVFAGTPGFSGIRTLDNTLTRREQATTRITNGPLIIKFVEQNSSTSTEPNLTDSSNLNAHATSSLPFFDDIDTYNSGSGRNRLHVPSNYLVKNTTLLSSNALLDFSFDPTDLS